MGAFLGLALLKFGNPVILDHVIPRPQGWAEVWNESWPAIWGYALLFLVAVVGTRHLCRPRGVPVWAWGLPLGWFGWQCLSALQTVDSGLTAAVIPHFLATLACFFIGLLALGRRASGVRLFVGIGVALVVVLFVGARQYHGGLEQDRRFFLEHEKSGWQQVPVDHLRELEATRLLLRRPDGSYTVNPAILNKLGKNRIFSTLVYPNTLAGVILLLLPPVLFILWKWTRLWRNVARGVIVGMLAYLGFGCLYWTQSKAGWLVAVILLGVVAWQSPWPRGRWKAGIAVTLVLVGLAAFAWRFSGYLQGGARSAAARLDYWEAAAKTAIKSPLLGSGPGTFYASYRQLKRPESEMARLAHNDYLQQFSDSGFPGGLAFLAMVIGSLVVLYRRIQSEPLHFWTWVGLLGWALHGFFEFGLYIPAMAWTAFCLMGWLWAAAGPIPNGFDKGPARA